MSVAFLNPWLWVGAVAVAAPLWLHWRRRHEARRLVFPGTRFLEEVLVPRASARRLEDPWLLLLRLLAVLSVVAAFTWPYLQGREPLVVAESRVYILDHTLSHQAGGGWARDVERVRETIRRAGPAEQVAVVELTGQPRVLVGFGDTREEALAKLENPEPGFQRGSYLAAFRLAQTLLGASLGATHRIVLLGDNQANQWAENTGAPPFLRGVEVEIPPVTASNAPNFSVSSPRVQRVLLGEGSLVDFSAQIHHTGAEGATVTVSLTANGESVIRREIQLGPAGSPVLIQAQWETDPARWLRGEVSVEGSPDVLAADDRAVFGLPPLRAGRVAAIARSVFLRAVLAEEVMRGRWTTEWVEAGVLENPEARLPEADVLVLESSYLTAPASRRWVQAFLEQGRGVVLWVNQSHPAALGVLRQLGFESAGVFEPTAAEPLGYALFSHPLLHPFRSADFGNLLDIRMDRYERLRSEDAVPLLFTQSGEPLFWQSGRFPGRLFVAGFGADREHTTWPTHVSFVPFLDLCLQNARADRSGELEHEPGAVIPWLAGPGREAREVVLREGATELARVPLAEGRALLTLPVRPGLYEVAYDAATEPEALVAVNPPPKESELTYEGSPEALRLWRLPGTGEADRSTAVGEPAPASRAAILRQTIWWWLLLAGLGLLAVEGLWAAQRRAAS